MKNQIYGNTVPNQKKSWQSAYLFWALLLMSFICTTVQAQNACNCDPTNNLVSNGDFSAGNTGFGSDLPYQLGCVQESYYVSAIPRDKCSLFPGTLFDHTLGDSTGSYLIVDGPRTATTGNTIWEQTLSVTGGQIYNFSFWVQPRFSSSNFPLSLGLFVNGVAVSPTFVPSNSTAWEQFCTQWQRRGDTSGPVTISLRQLNNFGEIGYDYGIDDIYFGSCRPPCDFDLDLEYNITPFGVDFQANGNYPNSPYFQVLGVQWDFGDGTTGSGQNTSHTYIASGEYEVCLTVWATNGKECCTRRICKAIRVQRPVDPCELLPKADFTIRPRSRLSPTYTFNEINLSGFPLSGITLGYYWDFGDGTTATGQDAQHSYTANGVYDVCLTVFYYDPKQRKCCSFQICKKVRVFVFVNPGDPVDPIGPAPERQEEGLTDEVLKIFPTPSDGHIQLSLEKGAIQSVGVYDGPNLVYRYEAPVAKSKVSLDLPTLKKGFYTLKVQNANGTIRSIRTLIE